jgi:hypothetical protein
LKRQNKSLQEVNFNLQQQQQQSSEIIQKIQSDLNGLIEEREREDKIWKDKFDLLTRLSRKVEGIDNKV